MLAADNLSSLSDGCWLMVRPGILPQDQRNALAGIDILRKICNHPDLLQRLRWEGAEKYGDPVRSGKLTVALKARAPTSTSAVPIEVVHAMVRAVCFWYVHGTVCISVRQRQC